MDTVITTAEAARKYGIDERRLLGAIWLENQQGGLTLPLGDFSLRMVHDDLRLQAWVEKQRALN